MPAKFKGVWHLSVNDTCDHRRIFNSLRLFYLQIH